MVGVEIELSEGGRVFPPRLWSRSEDGSIDGQETGEYKFIRPLGLTCAQDALRTFATFVYDHNCKVNETCGTHIHIDMREVKEREYIWNAFGTLEPLFLALVPRHRRENIDYCESVESCSHEESRSRSNCYHECANDCYVSNCQHTCDNDYCTSDCPHLCDETCVIHDCLHTCDNDCYTLIEADPSKCRYHTLNFKEAYRQHKSLEYRFLPGSVDMQYICNWMVFLYRFTFRYKTNSKKNRLWGILIDRYGIKQMLPYLLGQLCYTIEEYNYFLNLYHKHKEE